MAGHNKWSSIKHKKAATDAKRGKIFTKLIRKITVAAKEGGGDPDSNAQLRLAIDKARAANMPKEKVQDAIKRGLGTLEGVTYENIVYEGYGPSGVAMIAEVLTDNRNRTVAEIRHMFSRADGNLGQDGCVAWMFDVVGQFVISAGCVPDEDTFMMAALDAGADDVITEGDYVIVRCPPDQFIAVKSSLAEFGHAEFEQAELTRIPKNTIRVDGAEAKKVLNLMEALEDNDDVQNVYANFDISEEYLESGGD